jgi:nucleotide-binding universal stress UspA family protein
MNTASPSIKHILVPYDFGDTAQHALDFALGIAAPLGARVTLVFAYDVLAYGFPEAPAMQADTAQIEHAARAALESAAVRARRPGVEVGLMLRKGTPWSEINATAEEMKADLIVMGTHGRRGIARALLGSVAEKVVRTAPCPVLIVHGAGGVHR